MEKKGELLKQESSEILTINYFIAFKKIYKEEELDAEATTEFFSVVQNEGRRNI